MSKTFIILFLALLTLIAAYIRIDGVGNYYYSEDEAFHVGVAEGGNLEDVLHYSLYEAHPPLGHILRHYWLKISDEIWFVRSLSLLFGLALIPLYYRIGKILSGELTGLCCAILMTFSYGAIIQSYVVRNYIILLFFISCAFYYYLRWRRRQTAGNLLYYFFFCELACLTHFSAIFTVFCIAAYETVMLSLYRKKLSVKLNWLSTNALLGILSIGTYIIWRHTLLLARPYFSEELFTEFSELFLLPTRILFYILSPSKLIIVTLLLCAAARLDNKVFRQLLALTCIALITALFLFTAGIYPGYGSRHDIWLVPFILPTAGWVCSHSLKALGTRYAKSSPFHLTHIQQILVITFALAELALYKPHLRFFDSSEYGNTMEEWRDISNYLNHMGRGSLIVSDKDDIILEASFYPYLGDGMFSGNTMATLMPYQNTHILFNPYYHHIRTRAAMLGMMEEAEKRHILDGIDTLFFVYPVPQAYENTDFVKALPVSELMSCGMLDKQIIVLSDNFKLLQVQKAVFFSQVIAENGKAHACLKDYPGMERLVEPRPKSHQGP